MTVEGKLKAKRHVKKLEEQLKKAERKEEILREIIETLRGNVAQMRNNAETFDQVDQMPLLEVKKLLEKLWTRPDVMLLHMIDYDFEQTQILKSSQTEIIAFMENIIARETGLNSLFLKVLREQKVAESADIVQGHYQHFFKCMTCSLHFIVLSWYRDTTPFCYCPECDNGKQDLVKLKTEECPQEIMSLTSTGESVPMEIKDLDDMNLEELQRSMKQLNSWLN